MGCGASTEGVGAPLGASTFSAQRSSMVVLDKDRFMQYARDAAESTKEKYPRGRHLVVVYNPMASFIATKTIVEETICPMLQAAGVKFDVVKSKFKGFAASYFRSYDFSKTNGVVVCGGDRFVNEIVSALLEGRVAVPVPVGIVPAGAVNALATHLDQGVSSTRTRMVMQSVLTIIRDETRPLDVLEVVGDGMCRYALSMVGWGLPGAVAVHVERMWWKKRNISMTPASLLSEVSKWPQCRALLAYPRGRGDDDQGPQWEERNIAMHGLLACNLPSLGKDYPISKSANDSDGHVVVAMVYEKETRQDVVRAAVNMAKGKRLVENKNVIALRLTEFKLTPHEHIDAPFVIDGETMASGPVHVRVLPGKLKVFGPKKEVLASSSGDSGVAGAAEDSGTEGVEGAAAAASGGHGSPSSTTGSDPLKDSRISNMSVTLKETKRPSPLLEDDLNTTAEVKRVMHNTSLLGGRRERKRQARQVAVGEQLKNGIEGALEFVEDEFDELGTSSEEGDGDVGAGGGGAEAGKGASGANGLTSDVRLAPKPRRASGPAAAAARLVQVAALKEGKQPHSSPLLPRRDAKGQGAAAAPSRSKSAGKWGGKDKDKDAKAPRPSLFTGTSSNPSQPKLVRKLVHMASLPAPTVADADGDEVDEDEDEEEAVAARARMKSARKSEILTSIEKECTRAIEAVVELAPVLKAPGHVTIVFNPVSGQGKAQKVVDKIVIPVLDKAGVRYTAVATQYRGFATEHVAALDLSTTNGVIVCGGDGMVSEVITGLMQRKDAAAREFPVGIVAVGTANAMANYLDKERSKNHVQLVSNAALAVASGNTTRVDVLEIKGKGFVKYALSCVGWGLAGAVGLQADKLRWVPGQKQARYDIAGFVTLIADWPVMCPGILSYPVTETGGDGRPVQVWKRDHIACINLIASNVPKLGNAHPISKDITANDGKMVVASINQRWSRTKTVQAAMGMKRGRYLADAKPMVDSIFVSEFKLMPLEGARGADIPFNIDGDPVDACPIHVRVLHQGLKVFCLPDVVEESFA